MRLIRIVLVVDHCMLLESLAFRIDAEPDFQVVGTASSGELGLRLLLKEIPDVAVLDVDLPDRSPFELVSRLKDLKAETKPVFLTGLFSDVLLDQAIQHDARGYFTIDEPVERIIDGIRRVAAGEHCFSEAVSRRLEFDPKRKRYRIHSGGRSSSLTGREIEVLRHLAKGGSVKEVGRAMHLSHKSIDSHKYRIMRKLGIHDRVELARWAIREGFVLP